MVSYSETIRETGFSPRNGLLVNLFVRFFVNRTLNPQRSIARTHVILARFLTLMAQNQALTTVADCGISTFVVIARFTLNACGDDLLLGVLTRVGKGAAS